MKNVAKDIQFRSVISSMANCFRIFDKSYNILYEFYLNKYLETKFLKAFDRVFLELE